MKFDEFEKKIRQQPFRWIPRDWREDILRAAREQVPSPASPQAPRLALALLTVWRELIQPCRYAWSAMAALWLTFWLMNAQTQIADAPKPLAMSTRRDADRVRVFQEQRRVLVELTGPVELSPAEPSRPSRPKPRSERTLETRNC